MFTVFGEGKCPLCGSAGKVMEEEIFFCHSCKISFNNYTYSGVAQKNDEKVFWN